MKILNATERANAAEQRRAQDEVTYAKAIQNETGCTWSEALRVAFERLKQ